MVFLFFVVFSSFHLNVNHLSVLLFLSPCVLTMLWAVSEPVFVFSGDDAIGVKWMDLDSSLQLYASHVDFLKKTAERLKASW